MKVVAYCRYSSENQRDGYSIEAQVGAIKAFCASAGHSILTIYIDEARSGLSDNREQFQQMIADSSNGSFEAVVVHKLDRFARDRYDAAIYKKKLKDNGVKVLSVLERLDDSPESIMLESVIEGMAEYYSRNLAREVLKGKNASALKGNHSGGMCPFGYKDVDKRYVIVPEEAIIVKKIFADYAEELPMIQIIKNLDSLGYRTRKGLKFEHAGLKNILKNTIYIGDLTYNKDSSFGADPVVIENVCEPIVDKATFYKCQERLASPRTRAVPKSKSERNYILTGLLYCSCCGGPITGHTSIHRIKRADGTLRVSDAFYYKCHKSVSTVRRPKACPNKKMLRKERLEEYTYRLLMELIFKEDTLDFIAKEIRAKIAQEEGNADSEIASLRKELEKINLKCDRLLDIYLEGKIEKSTYSERSMELSKERAALDAKLKYTSSQIPPNIDVEKIKNALAQVVSKKDSSPEFKARIIKLLVDRIEVDIDSIEYTFRLPIGPNGSYSCLKEKLIGCFSVYTRISIDDFSMNIIPTDIINQIRI